MFTTKKINVIGVAWKELANCKGSGNILMSNVNALIQQAFGAEKYIQIEDEKRIWHCSEIKELIDFIKEHLNGGEKEK